MSDYKPGKIVKGIITGVQKYGIFVDLDNYYSGLIHISEISDLFVKDVNEYGKVGDIIYTKILEIDEAQNHVKLSIKGINHKVKPKKERKLIKEVGSGFKILEENLNNFIVNKLKEISQK
ncbi:MAG: S1 RNA-binding domain-containing protein [Tenericutes bacterium]|jgi:predicted RNA-binding protein with RPS1 domain|nr:S1 RNA-binding domain-containing protein [Bacilli bacterium]MDD4623899.1 S1 RNA-binding domain-containing protein [Bacilli bacterium]MDD4831644.1 S1 RNA-binding domain-containing protein [Bacilli bacterium]NLV89972.1 S1 RNA-binding domain-containing protein [Mycoplasmatota bacterium]